MKRPAALLLVVTALAVSWHLPGDAQEDARPFVPVTDAMLRDPDPANWLMWRRTLNGWGYSPLDEVNRNTVTRLRRVWSQELGPGNSAAAPLVYDGVMYVPNAGDYIQAFNAKTGDLLWEYRRPNQRGRASNRVLGIWGTTIINASGDNFMYAIDARTGTLVWETPVLDPQWPATASSGPIVADGKIFTGRQCQPGATHEGCVVTAHDAATGKELWRARTIPRPGEPGDETWGGVPMEERWHVGTWMVPSYDPELNLLIVGTSVTIPAPKFVLGGVDQQHLYHNSTLALDGDTGRLVWYYQHVIDHWDLDHPFERLLVDTEVAPDPGHVSWMNPNIRPGETRKVVTGIPGKTGLVYTLDRQTGEFLWARPTVMQNVIQHIDGATGKVTVNPDTIFTEPNQTKMICPGATGGKNWPAGAYSPLTGMMYYPLQNLCMNATTNANISRNPRGVYGLSMPNILAPGTENVGSVWAISARTGATGWTHQQRAGTLPLMTTGGGLVFGGDANGAFRAFDDTTGAVLWETNLGTSVSGFPVTFSVDGKQYVAVSTGRSLVSGSVLGLTPELRPLSDTATMFVFALP